MARIEKYYLTINSGSTVSDAAPVTGATNVSATISLPTSSSVYLQGSVDGSSYARVFRPSDGGTGAGGASGAWKWDVGSGDAIIDITPFAGSIPYVRFESGAAQTDVASITVAVKLL